MLLHVMLRGDSKGGESTHSAVVARIGDKRCIVDRAVARQTMTRARSFGRASISREMRATHQRLHRISETPRDMTSEYANDEITSVNAGLLQILMGARIGGATI